MAHLSRRDFLKLSVSATTSLALSPFLPAVGMFDDSQQVRVATSSVSVFSAPNDQSLIVGQWFRDELVNVYEEVNSGTPAYNPIWYRVWGGYMHRARLQKVKVIFNEPLSVKFPSAFNTVSEFISLTFVIGHLACISLRNPALEIIELPD